MRSSRWRTDTSYSAKKRSDLRWRVERDLIAVWMTLPMAESKLKISNICYQRNPGRTWSSRMNSVDLKEFWTRSSLSLASSETRAMPKAIKSLILDHKWQSLKEILIS